jgi:uncharacterized membrane protein YdfJ with MMPL/SSD domain
VGWGESLLGFESNGGIANWLPMLMFVILLGLSIDYHVFILSRIREIFDRLRPLGSINAPSLIASESDGTGS